MAETAAATKEEVKVRIAQSVVHFMYSFCNHDLLSQPTPVFGSGTVFGSGGGFGAFTGVASTAETAADGDEEDGAAPEEECQAEYKPVVQLEEVETSTGEEDEQALLEL